MSKYMLVLFCSGIVPFIVSFYPALKFYKNWKGLLVSIAVVVLFFGAWDVGAVLRHHWRFEPDGVGNINIINLPLEEVLFFIVIPFCCLFTWEVVLFIKRKML